MFKQVKSAIFWTLIYKFRKRLTLVAILLSIVLLSQWIYSDIVEYLKLTDKIEYLHLLLPFKWIVILFNIGLSVYLLLTLFKQDKEEQKIQKKEKKNDIYESSKESIKKGEKFTSREKEFLTKKIRSEAEILMDKED